MSKQVQELDDRLEQFLDSLAFESIDTELTPELKAERRKRADKDDFEFCKIYFPSIFTDPFNGLHEYIKNIKTGVHGVSGCRFYGKSAFTYISRYIKPVALGGIGMIGLGLRTQKHAIKRAESLHRLIRRNKKLCYDFDINFQQDRQGDYIINHKQIITFGKEEGLRGLVDDEFKRFQIIILDDLFNRITVTSQPDNDQVYEFVTGEVSGALEDTGCCIWLYNMTSETSPGKKYSDEYPELCYNLPARNEEGNTNWEGSKWTNEKLAEMEASLSYDVWMGDWMNSPILVGDVFDIDWIRTININTLDIIASLTAVDPSHGQSPAACYKSAITMAYTRDKRCVITDIYLRKEDYSLMFDYLDQVRSQQKFHKAILWENDFSQWNLAAPYYSAWTELRKKYLPIVVYYSKGLKTAVYGSDKEGRIMNLVHPFQMGSILVNQDIVNNKDYQLWRSQYLGFGKKKEKLDGLDASATAYIMLPRYVNSGSFKSLAGRQFDGSADKSWLHNR